MPTTKGAAPFPPVSYAAWRAGVEAELGPDAVSRRLRATTEDGIGIEPLYAPGGPGEREARMLEGRVAGLLPDGLRLRHRLSVDLTDDELRAELAGGLEQLASTAGLAERKLLELAQRPARLDRGTPPRFELFEDLTSADGMPLSAGLGLSHGDLIARWLRYGGTSDDVAGNISSLAEGGRHPDQPPQGSLFCASGDAFFDAGATAATTLGATIAVALEYLRALDEALTEEMATLETYAATHPHRAAEYHTEMKNRGGLDRAAAEIEIRLPCGPRFFESAAMLRAARLVWARVLELAGVSPMPLTLAAVTGRRTLTLHDPWNNALRNTAVAFAAAVGGADVLQLLPHDIRTGVPSAAALRLARTTGLILEEESFLRRVVDPAEGSWFLESLTADIAAAAWEEMRRIDAEGGIIASIESGALARRIAAQAAARHERVRRGEHRIVGVTDHPVQGEKVTRSEADVVESDPSRPFPFRPDAMPVEAA